MGKPKAVIWTPQLIGIEIEAINTLDIQRDLFFQQFSQIMFYHDLGPGWQPNHCINSGKACSSSRCEMTQIIE